MKNTSLSKIIKFYLSALDCPKNKEENPSPIVKSISGVMEMPEHYDVKKEYMKYLFEKYSRWEKFSWTGICVDLLSE